MAKQIIWNKRAHQDRKEILQYWRIHNKSNEYSIKLNLLIKKGIDLVAAHPHIGRRTNIENVRVKLVRDYLIFYEEAETAIFIFPFGIIEEIQMKFHFHKSINYDQRRSYNVL